MKYLLFFPEQILHTFLEFERITVLFALFSQPMYIYVPPKPHFCDFMEYEEKFTDSKQKFLHSDNSSNTTYVWEKIVQPKLFNLNFFVAED